MIALLIVLLVPLLFATGLVKVQWENGRPRLIIDRQRAAEAKREAAEKVRDLQAEHRGDLPRPIAEIGRQLEDGIAEVRIDQSPPHRNATYGEALQERLSEDSTPSALLAPENAGQEGTSRQAVRPLPRLKQALSGHR